MISSNNWSLQCFLKIIYISWRHNYHFQSWLRSFLLKASLIFIAAHCKCKPNTFTSKPLLTSKPRLIIALEISKTIETNGWTLKKTFKWCLFGGDWYKRCPVCIQWAWHDWIEWANSWIEYQKHLHDFVNWLISSFGVWFSQSGWSVKEMLIHLKIKSH